MVWHDMEGYLAGALATWNSGVSGAHVAICRNGEVVLCCRLENIAWHAGTDGTPGSGTYGRTPFWRAHNINPYSVGIELEGFVASGYTQAQLDSCVRVGAWLARTYDIPTEHTMDQIPGHHRHSELSSQRSDPGPLFPLADILSKIKALTSGV